MTMLSRPAVLALGLVLAHPGAAAAQNAPGAPPAPAAAAHPAQAYRTLPAAAEGVTGLRRVEPNDQRRTAGRMVNGELRVELEAVEAEWYPRGPGGPRIVTPAFAEVGGPPQVPAPLIRAQAGVPVRVTIRNTLPRMVMMRGLLNRDSIVASRPTTVAAWAPDFIFSDSVIVQPGETKEVRFVTRTPVSSFYFGRVQNAEGTFEPRSFVPGGTAKEGAFVGGLIVDPPGRDLHGGERVMVITRWGHDDEPGSHDLAFKLFVNGLSWPWTERLEHTVGDTVHWRVINTSLAVHPMHMHGFYFTVNSRGDGDADSVFAPANRPHVVTDVMGELGTLTMTWVPQEPGNWLFHCHFLRHSSPIQRFAIEGPAPEHSHDHGEHMAGLVTGITVHPAPGWSYADPTPARRIDLWTGERPNVHGDRPGYSFIQQEGPQVPAPDSTRAITAPLVLRRGEPTQIVVHNRFPFPLSVHWHGLELPSQYDGTGHWSGAPGATRAPIAPGDSTTVIITPKRAGTFMYHVHGERAHELAQGLAAALVVLEPGEEWDTDRNRLFMLAGGGAGINPRPGRLRNPTLERFQPGQAYRLRFAHVSPDESREVRIRRNGQLQTWRPIAKDGADLPEHRRVPRESRALIGVGETFDFEWVPTEPGVYVLEVVTRFYSSANLQPLMQRIALGVGDGLTDEALLEAVRPPPAPPPGQAPAGAQPGQPGQPPAGQPGQAPPAGQPAPPPAGQPAPPPPAGQPTQAPAQGQPAPPPVQGQPAQAPVQGRTPSD